MGKEEYKPEEQETASEERPEEQVPPGGLTPETVHRGQLTVRFEEMGTSVNITWIPDDPTFAPFRESFQLVKANPGTSYTECVNECVKNDSIIRCIFICLGQHL
jgi:hypothetical protein